MAISTVPKQYIVAPVTFPAVTVEASKPAVITASAAKEGYTPIGILGIAKTLVGSGTSTYITLTTFYLSGDTITTGWHNDSTVDRTITVTCSVLYEKSS